MLQFLNENASAIQAISSVVIAALTIALVAVTEMYRRAAARAALANEQMAVVMTRQFERELAPLIQLSRVTVSGGTVAAPKDPHVGCTIRITNFGSIPVTTIAIVVRLLEAGATECLEEQTAWSEERAVAPNGDSLDARFNIWTHNARVQERHPHIKAEFALRARTPDGDEFKTPPLTLPLL